MVARAGENDSAVLLTACRVGLGRRSWRPEKYEWRVTGAEMADMIVVLARQHRDRSGDELGVADEVRPQRRVGAAGLEQFLVGA